jgi:hypothetical protein
MCSYNFIGSLCFSPSAQTGIELYTGKYGSYDESWQPADCH